MIEQFVKIKTDFEATHSWPECPYDSVAFLRNEHRHKIYITVEIKTDDDRQLEFFVLKNNVDDIIENLFGEEKIKRLGKTSMEEICHKILGKLITTVGDTDMIIEASEDGQVSGKLIYTKEAL